MEYEVIIYLNKSFGNSLLNLRADGRMERKSSSFHLSKLLVLLLNDCKHPAGSPRQGVDLNCGRDFQSPLSFQLRSPIFTRPFCSPRWQS